MAAKLPQAQKFLAFPEAAKLTADTYQRDEPEKEIPNLEADPYDDRDAEGNDGNDKVG